MLSIKPVKNAADASHYYSAQDNYYLSDHGELEHATSWHGKGSAQLGLSGQVSPELFLQLLEGRLPSGQQLGKVHKDGTVEHRPATDITLSAPKSVSLLALVGGDNRLLNAHNMAVREALDAIQKMAAEARVTVKGETSFEKTNNLTIALFQHTTSRELDANLHDHCLIMNMTERMDGQWRALSSRSKQDKAHLENGFREILYKNQHYFGLIYNSALAKETCDIGYDIEVKDRYGNFEIKGVSESYIEHTSKRRNQIIKSLQDKGLKSAKAAEKANLDTRKSKESVDSGSLTQYWKKEATQKGVDFESLIEKSKQQEKGRISTIELIQVSETAREAVDDAIEQLAPFSTQIKHGDLVRMAFTFARGTIHHDELEAEISERFKDKRLRGVASTYYTTAQLIATEKAFIQQFKASLGKSISRESQASGIAADVLRSRDRVQLIHVYGLTYEKKLIESLVHESEAAGCDAHILHVGRMQTNYLSQHVSRDNASVWQWFKNFFKDDLVQTVAGFQARDEARPPSKKEDVVIVHDAQKLSYQDLMSLEKLVEKNKSKLVLLNNMRSTEGVHAGSPIKALDDAGFTAIHSAAKEKRATFEVVQTKAAASELAIQFSKLSTEERQATTVVALTNKAAANLSDFIRAELKSAGVISVQSKDAQVLSTQTLSDVQKRNPKFYEVGFQVTFNPYSREQSHYRVIGKKDQAIELQNREGNRQILSLDSSLNFAVTKTKTMAFSVGDSIVTEKNIYLGRAGKLLQGTAFVVEAISEAGVTLLKDKTRLYFSNDELHDLALTHDYVRKPNQLANKVENIWIAASGYQINKNTLGELGEYASTIRLFTLDKSQAALQLENEKISFTIDDVARGKPSLVYRDCVFANLVIRQDLESLSEALSQNESARDSNTIASMAVSYATAKIAEREAAFEHKVLLGEAMVYAMGKVKLPEVERAILQKVESGDLIHADTFWISKESLALEHSIFENNRAGQNILAPIANNKRLIDLPQTLTQGQKDAITLATTAQDRFTSVQGLAGTGKTTMMKEIQTIAHESGYAVIGLAPMHISKDELISNGIESITISKFLIQDKPYSEKTLFIVDEASMIGNQNYLALQNKVMALNARALFAGDMTQLQSPSSGIPHELTIKTATQKIANMQEIMRQNPNPALKQAVIHASDREIEASMAMLTTINPEQYVKRQPQSTIKTFQTTSVITVDCCTANTHEKDYSLIYKAIADDYLSRIPAHQKETLVIAHAHEDRREINALIREGLQAQGKIEKEEITLTRLAPLSLSQAELLSILSYQAGDTLRFDANYSVSQKGEYFNVTRVDTEQRRLHCTASDGTIFSINPAAIALKSRMSVYRSEEAQLAKGDNIRLRLTDNRRGFVANKEYTVEAITKNSVLIQNEEGSFELQIDKKQDAHWDYSYTTTAFGAQGQTATFVLALELAKRAKATTHRSHEIDITRSRVQATIYTEDKAGLISRMAKLEGDKTSAHQIYEASQAKKEVNKLKAPSLTHVTNHKATEYKQDAVTSKDLNHALTQQMESLSHQLLGTPNHNLSRGESLRYGKKGSLSINLKNGLWYNFETGEKGNALQLIASQMGFNDFKDTVTYAKDFLNHKDDWFIPMVKSKEYSRVRGKDSPNKGAYAKKLYEKSISITGTLAEKYLKAYRGLNEYQQADLRFIPDLSTWHGDKKTKVPALLSIARDEQGDVNHVQAIRLDPLTGDKDGQSKIIKQTYGAMKGCFVELNKRSTEDTTHIAEGVETGLSLLEHNKNARVIAVLSKSNFLNVDLKRLTDKVVLCLDNDGEKTFSDEIVKKAVVRLQEAGKTASIVMPNKVGRDFNDVLRQEGVAEVKVQLSHIVSQVESEKRVSQPILISNNVSQKIKEMEL